MHFLSTLLSFKFLILYLFVASATYVQLRGQVRLKFTRQLVNHSTLMAPLNCLFYLTSRVPNQAFIDKKYFPELKKLEDNWQVIREEAEKLLEQPCLQQAHVQDDIGFNSFFKRGWRRFYLKWYGTPQASALQHCPKTLELLQDMPSIKAAMFTLLPAGSKIKKHRDPFAGSLRYHLGILTPNSNDCYIDVDGQRHVWFDGEGVVFDETFVHEAYNKTDTDRLIFFCDVERPLKFKLASVINRWASKYLIAAASSPNDADDKTGVINQFFKRVAWFKQANKRVKQRAPITYRALQAAAILVLVAWLVL
jgi:beta-hydroxylase